MGEAPYLRDDRIVAESPATAAPEYHLRAVLRREFHFDSPAVRLVIEGPLALQTEYWDSHHVGLVIELLQRALPLLQRTEGGVEEEWTQWRQRIGQPLQGPA